MAGNGIEVICFHCARHRNFRSRSENSGNSGHCCLASHNPKEYNGYKVYWSDGGQIVPPHDKGIIERVRAVSGPAEVHWGRTRHRKLAFAYWMIGRTKRTGRRCSICDW